MIFLRVRWRRPTAAVASSFEQACHSIVAALLRHLDQAIAVMAIPFCVRAGIEQDLYDVEMTVADSEMNGWGIEISLSTEVRIGVEQTAHGCSIASRCCGDHIPNEISSYGVQFWRLDHPFLI